VKILALETTERLGTVAAMLDGKLLQQLSLSPTQRSAQSLAPGIRTLLSQVGWRADEVDLVATTVGPGSFTGLRIGVTTAKSFAYCAGAEILGVDTLEVIANRAPAAVERLSAAVDAQRGEVVAQAFERGADGWFVGVRPAVLLPIDAWLDTLDRGVYASGPLLRKIAGRLPGHVRTVDPQAWPPTAAAVARLAAARHAAGDRSDLWTLAPRYSRRSYAEEKHK